MQYAGYGIDWGIETNRHTDAPERCYVNIQGYLNWSSMEPPTGAELKEAVVDGFEDPMDEDEIADLDKLDDVADELASEWEALLLSSTNPTT